MFTSELDIGYPEPSLTSLPICPECKYFESLQINLTQERSLHSATNYLIASLAIADCLVGLLVEKLKIYHPRK